MLALRWDGERLQVAERPQPVASARRARVRVLLAGICSTDLQLLRGYMAFTGTPGHEVVGVVEDGPAELVGKRVVAEINFACGACPACARGLARHCPTRDVMGILRADGAFAEQVLEQVHVPPGCEAVVLGDGKLGLLVAQALHLAGARVECVGRHPRKLELLTRLGIATSSPSASPPPRRVDLVVEATGSREGLERAIALVRPRGTLVLKSTVADAHTVSLAPLVIDEVTVVGSRCGPFPPALAALARRGVEVAGLVDAVYPLEEGLAAVAHAGRPGALKVLLRP